MEIAARSDLRMKWHDKKCESDAHKWISRFKLLKMFVSSKHTHTRRVGSVHASWACFTPYDWYYATVRPIIPHHEYAFLLLFIRGRVPENVNVMLIWTCLIWNAFTCNTMEVGKANKNDSNDCFRRPVALTNATHIILRWHRFAFVVTSFFFSFYFHFSIGRVCFCPFRLSLQPNTRTQ